MEQPNKKEKDFKPLIPVKDWPPYIRDNIKSIYGEGKAGMNFTMQEDENDKNFPLGFVLIDGKKQPAVKYASGKIEIIKDDRQINYNDETWFWDGDKWTY